ncbi:MAG TPA: endolytic transglycosylase MltG [Xanthomonadaceae bacterium]|nr:endolytic transglycosylase MltG [Xanthomonadaceae bacterium]
MTEPTKKRSRILPAVGLLLVVLLAVAGVVGWHGWQDYVAFRDAPIASVSHERVLEVERGDSFHRVLRKLRRLGIDEGADWQWQTLAWETDVARRLQVGEYAIGHGISPRELLDKLESGRVIQHRFTIVEGWTFRELRAALASHAVIEQTVDDLPDGEIMALLGMPEAHPEGWFLPETYQFTRGATDMQLLRRAHLAMRRALDDAWQRRAAHLPIDEPYQALILASIIEKETGVAHERGEIAGVFARRLKSGMRLQTDPTVIYGRGPEASGRLRRVDLTTDTPYNTYTRFGLPPTPIAMPGRAALEAAVDPLDGDTLYFVSRGDGSHQFSRTLAEHNRAVQRYILGRSRNAQQSRPSAPACGEGPCADEASP